VVRRSTALRLALVWFAHIGMDRALGYGLKYDDAFTHTHLGIIRGREVGGGGAGAERRAADGL
jgi:hypothetical protein